MVERKNRTILDATRTIMMEGNVLHAYWREVVRNVVYTFNSVCIKGDTDKTPNELWFGHTPIVRYFKKIEANVTSEEMGK